MKKVLSLLLCLVLVLGMTPAAFAEEPERIVGYAGDFEGGDYNFDIGEVAPGYSYSIPITKDVFMTNLGTAPTALTAQLLEDSNVIIKGVYRKGSKCLDSVQFVDIDSDTVGIEVTMVDPFVNLEDQDFDFRFYLVFDSHRSTTTYTVTGRLCNVFIDINGDDDYVDLSHGYVALALEDNDAIIVDLGYGVSVYTKMFKDWRYYGIATPADLPDDDPILTKYPKITDVISLHTIGLNLAGNKIQLDTTIHGDGYVYNKDLIYLGRTNEMLPYSTRYYISSSRLSSGGSSGGSVVGGGGGSNNNKKSGGGGGGGGGAAAPAVVLPQNKLIPLDAATATAALKKAATANTTIAFKNISTIPLAVLQSLAKQAGKIASSTMEGNAVDVRISLDPAKVAKEINVSGSTLSSQAKAVKAKFDKAFGANVFVVSLGQKESFGTTVEVAAKMTAKLDTKSLYFYAYNAKTNTFTQFKPSYWMDKAGYLHFNTSLAGDIIITDKPLKK